MSSPPKPSDIPSKPTGDNAVATKEYGLSHTMYRISDAMKSIPFYTEVLGMTLISRHDSEGGKFTNYFLCYPSSPVPDKEKEPEKFHSWMWQQQGLLELCHNWNSDEKFYNGNEEGHRGFGHICIFVDDLHKAVERFDKLGVKFTKRPEEGSMRHIAFLADPDGYRVEVITRGK